MALDSGKGSQMELLDIEVPLQPQAAPVLRVHSTLGAPAGWL